MNDKNQRNYEQELQKSQAEFDDLSMEMALAISEFFQVLQTLTAGDFSVRAREDHPNDLFANFGKVINKTIVDLERSFKQVKSQQAAIARLSTPIIQVWDQVLCLPIVGVVDSKRAAEMMETLLNQVVETQCRAVIVDVTGVDVVDTQTADHFIKMIRAASLLGVKCMITGIKPQIAQTITQIGVDLSGIQTLKNLEAGLMESIRTLGYRVVRDA